MRRPIVQSRFDEVLRIKEAALAAERTGDEAETKALRIKLLVRAKVLLDHVDANDEEVQFALNFILGSFYRKLELWDDSVACAKRAVQLRPSSPGAVNSLYLTLVKLGRTVQALDVWIRFSEKFALKEYTDVIGEIYEDYKAGYLSAFSDRVELLAGRAGLLESSDGPHEADPDAPTAPPPPSAG